MACSNPELQGQAIALCQLCEVDPKIQWKCIDCDLLLCTKCKDKIHSKVKTAKEHRIINIKEVGTSSDQDTVQSVHEVPIGGSSDKVMIQPGNKAPVNLELSILQEYTTKFAVQYIQVSLDDSLWIGSLDNKKDSFFSFKSSRHLQKVKLDRDNLKIISSFNVDVGDIAITPSNDLILADGTPKLKQILYNSNKVTGSNYSVEPDNAWSVHVTRDNKVVVGAYRGEIETAEGAYGWEEGAVYVMDINGVHQKIYRHDNNNKPLFTRPHRTTSTNTGTLCVIDINPSDSFKGRLVMLRQGEVISVYTGHPNINNDKTSFIPNGVVSTSNDNIIVTDPANHKLHILNNTGSFLSYYDLQNIGLLWSLSFNMAGHFSILYIGCSSDSNHGKLYKLTLSGC